MKLDASKRDSCGVSGAKLVILAAGLIGAGLALPGCSSRFSSCREARTCVGDLANDDGGAGGASDSGVGGEGEASTGGAHTAAGFSGEASQGGEPPVTGALSIVSTTPSDSATAVERDRAIEVVFSSDVDEASISPETFVVTGPSGAFDGELNIDGAKVTFTPRSKWALLAEYDVTLSASIMSASRVELGRSVSFSFQTRDGMFREPQRLSAKSALNLTVEGNRAGHVVAHWVDLATTRGFAAFFDPATGQWGKAAPIDEDESQTFSSVRLCMDGRGNVFTSMDQTPPAWSRRIDGAWSQPSTAGLPDYGLCALADDGTAMLTWQISSGSGRNAMATSLSPANNWSGATTLSSGAVSAGIARYGSGFLALYTVEGSEKKFSRVFEPGKGWLTAKPVTDGVSGYYSFRTFEKAAIYTWADVDGRMRASLFDGTSWSTEDLGSVVGGNSSSLGPKGHVATWFYANNSYAARYDLDQGWLEPIKLGPTDGELFGPGIHVDDAGNALAAWRNGSTLSWRRSPHTTADWGPTESFLDQDPGAAIVQGAGNGEVVVVWQNPLGIWATRFE
jgi:hypothetical protein